MAQTSCAEELNERLDIRGCCDEAYDLDIASSLSEEFCTLFGK
jgi:hypothetical protein